MVLGPRSCVPLKEIMVEAGGRREKEVKDGGVNHPVCCWRRKNHLPLNEKIKDGGREDGVNQTLHAPTVEFIGREAHVADSFRG